MNYAHLCYQNCTHGKVESRVNHRVQHYDDLILVFGGVNSRNEFITTTSKISYQNLTISTVITDNVLCLQAFSLFSFGEYLYFWGGRNTTGLTNGLIQFDGFKFNMYPQHGSIPCARVNHSFAAFANRYHIIYGGNSGSTFYNDWHLLDLKTMTWNQLHPNLIFNPSLRSTMCWLNGKGIIMLNEMYDGCTKKLAKNVFYEFNIINFDTMNLRVSPIVLDHQFKQDIYVFYKIYPINNDYLIILGGEKVTSPLNKISCSEFETHNVCMQIDVETYKAERIKLKMKEKTEFQCVLWNKKLFLIGGILNQERMETELEVVSLMANSEKSMANSNSGEKSMAKSNSSEKLQDHRNKKVIKYYCVGCYLEYDAIEDECLPENEQKKAINEDYDYNYLLKLDQKVMCKLATEIRHPFDAIALLVDYSVFFQAKNINISLHSNSKNQIKGSLDQPLCYYLRIKMDEPKLMTATQINSYFLMLDQQPTESSLKNSSQPCSSWSKTQLEMQVLLMKLSSLRLGKSVLYTTFLKESTKQKIQILVVYFSSMQIQSPETNHMSFNNYHYVITYYPKEMKLNSISSTIQRSIIYNNVKHMFDKVYQYEQQVYQKNTCIYILDTNQFMKSALSQRQYEPQHEDIVLAESRATEHIFRLSNYLLFFYQLSSAATYNISVPTIFINQSEMQQADVFTLLEADFQARIIESIHPSTFTTDAISLCSLIKLYYFPQDYVFKQILIYYRGRMIQYLHCHDRNICGAIHLKDHIPVSLAKNGLEKLSDSIKLMQFLNMFKEVKRSFRIDQRQQNAQ